MKNIWLLLLSIFIIPDCKAQDTTQYSYDYARLIGGMDSLYRAIKYETILPGSCELAGRVFVYYLITESGETRDVSVAKGLCPVADSISIEIVKRLRYVPAKRNGKPVIIKKSIPIFFTKKNKAP